MNAYHDFLSWQCHNKLPINFSFLQIVVDNLSYTNTNHDANTSHTAKLFRDLIENLPEYNMWTHFTGNLKYCEKQIASVMFLRYPDFALANFR